MRALISAALVAALFAVSACGEQNSGAGPATATASPDSGATVATTTRTAAPTGRAPTVQSIEEAVSLIRGLPAHGEIPVSYINRDELQSDLDKQMTSEYPPDKLQAQEKVLKYMGLIDQDVNLQDALSQLLGEGIIGYYDDETKQLKVVSRSQQITPVNEITLAHELTHALQDQNFDLAGLTAAAGSGNSDRDAAVLALIEGDATMVDQLYTAQVMSATEMAGALLGSLGALGATINTPPYLVDSIDFSYLAGATFVSDLYSQGGWQRVDEAYKNPPQSTEQVLHPEKFLQAEPAVEVTMPNVYETAGPGWKLLDEDSIGEFDVTELIDAQLPQARAREAGAGWGGGRYQYYEHAGQPLLIMSLVWDTSQDADEFVAAVREAFSERYQAMFGSVPGATVLPSPDGAWALAASGKSTALVLAPTAETAAAVSTAAAGL